MRVEEVQEDIAEEVPTVEEPEEQIEEPIAKKRLYGKQAPSKAYLKGIEVVTQEDDDESAEVTKTITLPEVYQDLENWIPGMKAELDSQYSKDCLIPRTLEEVKECKEHHT